MQLFLDLTRAIDKVDHIILFNTLVDMKLFNTICKYNKIYTQIKLILMVFSFLMHSKLLDGSKIMEE